MIVFLWSVRAPTALGRSLFLALIIFILLSKFTIQENMAMPVVLTVGNTPREETPMLRKTNRLPRPAKRDKFQFELLEPRQMFSASGGLTLQEILALRQGLVIEHPVETPETPDAAPPVEGHADQSLTNLLYLPMVSVGTGLSTTAQTPLQLSGEVVINSESGSTLQWSKLSGPGTATFINPTLKNATVQFDQPGTYVLQLAATNHGTTGSALLTVRVTGSVPLAEYDLWMQDMIKYGRQHGEWLLAHQDDVPNDPPLAATYYDAARVFYQIADYTGDSSWNAYAEAAVHVYRDRYVVPNNGGVPGYWKFTRGLVEHYERTGDIASKNAALLIAQNGAYNLDSSPLEWTASAGASREIAYAIMNYLDAERVGAPRRDRLDDMVEQALGHLNQWFVEESYPQYSPFMFGLTADALMQYYEQVDQDPRILQMLKLGADWNWDHAWVQSDQAFWYGEGARVTGAADLNLLIAPAYEWLYQKTGDLKYRTEGDQIFAGGVKGAWLDGAKQFNQNYRVSFDFIKMRLSQTASQASNMSQHTEGILGAIDLGFAQIGNDSVLTDSESEPLVQATLTDSSSSLPINSSVSASESVEDDLQDKQLSEPTALNETDLEWPQLADFLLRRRSLFGAG
jgi:hypothetical protein